MLISQGWCWQAEAGVLFFDGSYFSCKAGAKELSFGWEVRVRSGRPEDSEDLEQPGYERNSTIGQWRANEHGETMNLHWW